MPCGILTRPERPGRFALAEGITLRQLLIAGILVAMLVGCVIVPGGPPGHGGIPPGHGGIPPGQAKKSGPPVLLAAPRLVLIPDTNIYVATGIDYDLFVVGGVYYFFYEGSWYRGPSHGGPWRSVDADDLPPGLRKGSPGHLKQKLPPGLRKG